jgi:hypothetical protein
VGRGRRDWSEVWKQDHIRTYKRKRKIENIQRRGEKETGRRRI